MERKKHLSMHLSTLDKDQYNAKLFEIIRKIYAQTLKSFKKETRNLYLKIGHNCYLFMK